MTKPHGQPARVRYGGPIPRVLLVALAFAGLTLQAGCLTGTEFRSTAVPAVHAGVTQIVDGLLNGLFAAIEPGGTSSSNSNDTGTAAATQ